MSGASVISTARPMPRVSRLSLLCCLCFFALSFAPWVSMPGEAMAGMNPDARIALDMRAPGGAPNCASLEEAYPFCRAITTSLPLTGEFEAVVVLYTFQAVTAVQFTLTWPAEWEVYSFQSCGDLTIGGDVQQNPMSVSTAWGLACMSSGSAGMAVGILRGLATVPGCVSVVDPDPPDFLLQVTDADFVIDPIVEWFSGCAGAAAPGDPCAFDSVLVADFMALNPEGLAPLEVDFRDASRGVPTSWLWDFGDGGTSTEQNPTHVYTTCGSYDVRLEVANATATDDTTRLDLVHVQDPLALAFSVEPASGCAPLVAQFTDHSGGHITTWFWQFGDGGTSTEQNPSHAYGQPGLYDVTLTASNPCTTATLTLADLVEVKGPPVASFEAGPTQGCSPLDVQFTDHSSGDPVAWLWDFGDGGTSTEPTPLHRYSSEGTYTVKLTATNACGAGSLIRPDLIHAGSELHVDFRAEPSGGCAPLGVQFTDLSDTTATAWLWEFGDSTTSHERHPYHVYASAGTFDVALSVTAACGTVRIVRPRLIHAQGPPLVDFAADPTQGCRPLSVQFTGMSDSTATAWAWDFGDGGTSTEQNPLHVYQAAGDYDVRLTVTGPCSSATLMREDFVRASGPVAARFEAAPTRGCAPLTVHFTDHSTGFPTSWLWDFGDGGTSAEQNPSHTYMQRSVFTVALTVSNACGTSDTTMVDLIRTKIFSPTFELVRGRQGVCPLDPVEFTNTTAGSVISWLWDFGDGHTSTERSPAHCFEEPGLYDISLTAFTECGDGTTICEDFIRILDYGHPDCAPVATQLQGPSAELRDGGIVIRWVVIPPSDHVGYNVLRSEAAAGPFTKVNPDLLPDLTSRGIRTHEYRDDGALPGIPYFYRLEAVLAGGSSIEFVVPYSVVLPVINPWFGQPRPSPFASVVEVEMGLTARETPVALAVYDLQGRRVKTLAQGIWPAGQHRLSWNGRDEEGKPVPAGVYFFRLEIPGDTWTRKVLLVR